MTGTNKCGVPFYPKQKIWVSKRLMNLKPTVNCFHAAGSNKINNYILLHTCPFVMPYICHIFNYCIRSVMFTPTPGKSLSLLRYTRCHTWKSLHHKQIMCFKKIAWKVFVWTVKQAFMCLEHSTFSTIRIEG